MPAVQAKTNQIDWAGIRAAAVALQNVQDAARRAAAKLPPDEAQRFIERVNKRALREGWRNQWEQLSPVPSNHAKPLSNHVQTGAKALADVVNSEGNIRILSLKEKREYLATVVRTPVGQVNEDSPLAQRVKRSTRTDKNGEEFSTEEIEIPGKLRAIELDAKLAGELDNNKVDPGLVSVTLVRLELSSNVRTEQAPNDPADRAKPVHAIETGE